MHLFHYIFIVVVVKWPQHRVQTLTRKQTNSLHVSSVLPPSVLYYCNHSPGPGFTWAGGAQSRGGGGVAQHSLRLRQQRPAPASTLWPVWAEWRGRTLPLLLQLVRGSSSSPSPVCEVWCHHQHWLQLQSVVIITEWAGMCWWCWSRYFTFCWYTLSTVDCRHLHRLNFLPMFRVSSISLTPQQHTTVL